MGAFTPLHKPRIGVAPADVPAATGGICAAAAVVGIPLLPFRGARVDRYARRPIIIRSDVAHVLVGGGALLAVLSLLPLATGVLFEFGAA